MFMPKVPRSSPKPACISAQTLRARARALASRGQSGLSGKRSARVSAIAMLSQIAKPSSISSGTRPEGASASIVFLNGESSSQPRRSFLSSKEMPLCFSSSQGRSDQEE